MMDEHHTKQNNASAKAAKRSYLKEKLFPPFEVMKSQSPVLSKLPFLLPFCYLARFAKILFSKERRQHATRAASLMNNYDATAAEKVSKILAITELGRDKK